MNEELKAYEEYKNTGIDWLSKIPSHWNICKNSALFKEVVDTNHNDLELLSILQDRGIVKHHQQEEK